MHINLKKALHRAGSFVKREAKKETRAVARVTAKAVPYVTGALSTVGGALFGPEVSLGLTAAGAGLAKYAGATAARAHGLHGRDARHAGLILEKKTIKSGLIGMGLGGAGASIVAGGLSLATAAPLLGKGLQLGLGALTQPHGIAAGVQTDDGSYALSSNPVGSDGSAAWDHQSMLGGDAPPDTSQAPGASPGSGNLLLILAGLVLASRKAA